VTLQSAYSINPVNDAERLETALHRLSLVTSAHKGIVSESSPLANTAAQKTLQSLSELTGMISSQTYTLPSSFRSTFGGSLSNRPVNTLGPAEEEVRRELRSLKGLLLNRRTFASKSFNTISGRVSG